MKKVTLSTIILLVTLLLSYYASAKIINPNISSLFAFNFIKNINWPDGNNKNLKLVLLTDDKEVIKSFKEMAESKKSFGYNIQVFETTNLSLINNIKPNVVYVSSSMESKMTEVAKIIQSKPILFIGEKSSSDSKYKADITMYEDESVNRVRFKIDEQAVLSHKLGVAYDLMQLATR